MVRAWLNEGADVEVASCRVFKENVYENGCILQERDSSGATPLLLAAKGAGRTAERCMADSMITRHV